MVAVAAYPDTHPVRIRRPFYSDAPGAELHRYLDAEFVPRFLRDLQQRSFDSGWKSEDRFSAHDNTVVLRLPLHRTFYVVSCELSCGRIGLPPLDPRRITSAGFVIRRVGSGHDQSWMLEDDRTLGWKDTPTGARDPDVNRRICFRGVLHPRDPVPTYTGEQTHPLHTQTHYEPDGRRHTVLYGYLPLGGSYTVRMAAGSSPFDTASETAFREAAKRQLPWPFGYRPPVDETWLPEHTRPIENGRPTRAMFELIRALVNRHHLGEPRIPENEQLERFARAVQFYDDAESQGKLAPAKFDDSTRGDFAAWRRGSLWSYLESFAAAGGDNALATWLVRQEKAADDAGGLDRLSKIDLLPDASGGTLKQSLYLTKGDAQELRQLLGQRLFDQAMSKTREIPVPKFQQEADDVFQIVPFVRALDNNGKEHIYWGGAEARSQRFRVAAPFDPEASRPSLVQMPSLADLRKGLAKGLSILTPADTYSIVSSLNLKDGVTKDLAPSGEPPSVGIQWICSFSLPVITLVAMILLTIMISLLNIVFFWMPWVRICLPFPKVKQ
jgi:hypothetical protein